MPDLVEIVERHVPMECVSHKNDAGNEKQEWHGPCPWCKGEDRFRVLPNWRGSSKYPGWYACRKCGRHGDTIQFLREREGMGFREACEFLGIDMSTWTYSTPTVYVPAPGRTVEPPGEAWQQRANSTVSLAELGRWRSLDDYNCPALRYLHARGLTDETIRRYRLGWTYEDEWDAAGDWGLDGKSVWIPGGILIPTEIDGEVWSLKVRRPLPDRPEEGYHDDLSNYLPPVIYQPKAKYIFVPGSVPGLFGGDNLAGAQIAVVCEGEFDAMLLDQEAGDLVEVVTLGSASNDLLPRWRRLLSRNRLVLLAFDSDTEGQDAACKIRAQLGTARVVTVPKGKDITEFRQLGGDLRSWLVGEIRRLAPAMPGLLPAGWPPARSAPNKAPHDDEDVEEIPLTDDT